MIKLSAVETLEYIIELLLYYLENLSADGLKGDGFILGEKTAYAECLEIVQLWEHAQKSGLDFDIEARFPL